MKKYIRVLIFLFMMFLPAFAWSAATIENPGLETGSASPWVGSGTSYSIQSSEVYSGSYAMYIRKTGSQYVQTVTDLSPNTTYTLSAYVMGTNTSLYANNYDGGSGSTSVAFTDRNTWVYGELTFTTGASDTSVEIVLAKTGQGLSYGDDFELTSSAASIPVADFSASPTSVTEGGSVSFTDLSTNTPTAWSWTFTGGTPSSSTSQNPSVVYSTAGTYTAELTATNSAGSDIESKTDYITVTPPAPVAEFSANTTTVALGGTVIFSDLSTNSPTSWSWTFTGGTPSSSTAQNPSVVYSTAGTYSVELTATNAGGSDIESKTSYITVIVPTPVAEFSADSTSIVEGGTINFSDLSTGQTTSWSWSFTGGTPSSSTAQNPSVVYSTAGTYTVELTATNSTGSDIETKTDYITVTVVPPVAAFSADVTTVTEGGTVTFSDLSTNSPTSWSWTFGGGTPSSSTTQNPSVVYNTAGTYDVSLTATNAGGSDVETVNGYITVNAAVSGNLIENPGLETGSASPWVGSGTTYDIISSDSNSGTYCMSVLGAGSQFIQTVTGLTPSTTYTLSAYAKGMGATIIASDFGGTDVEVAVADLSSWVLYSLEFTTGSSSTSATIMFYKVGSGPALSYADDFELTGPGTGPVAPVAGFSANSTSVSEGGTVNFTDTSTNTPTSWSWTFEGGTPSSSTSQNPSVTYNTAGTYYVSLTATNSAGSDTLTSTNYIAVTSGGSIPVAEFSADSTSVTEGGSVDFTDQSTNSPTSWSWTFDGGTPSSSTSQNPSVTYSTAGSYVVSLTATNSYGSDSEIKTGYIAVMSASAGDYTVVDTNQADCFDAAGNVITCGSSLDGQDAQYTTATPSYTKDSSNDFVTDNNTGLIWERHHSSELAYTDAASYCAGLSYGGYTWRVPNIKELYSLIDFNGYTGSMNDTPSSWTSAYWNLYVDGSWDTSDTSAIFIQETGSTLSGDRILDGQNWSSTDPVGTTMNNNDSILGGNFLDGRIKAYPKTSLKYTRCVTGSTSYGENSFTLTDSGDTVTDSSTGLVWTRAYSNDTAEFPDVLSIDSNGGDYGAMDWENALSFCENLDYAGSTDWRLPDVKQLHSIFKNPDTEGLPAIDTGFFDLAKVDLPDYCNGGSINEYPYFWSSTTHMEYKASLSTVAYGDKASYVAFGRGLGSMDSGATWIDAHAPGAQRSDPKTGDPSSATWGCGFGPQGDYISIYNFVRCVRDAGGSVPSSGTAEFSATPTAINEGASVDFTDSSTDSPISWSWTFEGGTPSSSTAQNPQNITYSTGGSYAVTLTTTYSDGSDSETKTDYITVTATSGVYGGYMLFSPLGSYTTYLMDTDESVYKTWTSSYRPGNSVYLLEDGTLLRTGNVVNGNIFTGTGGIGGIVEMYNWAGTVTWSYTMASDTECLHHDVEYLPNGNILMIAWEYKSSTEAEDAGRNPSLLADGQLWPDKIIEVDPSDDSIVWEWYAWDHLIQDYSSSADNYGTVADHPELIDLNYVDLPSGIADWNHINAVDYNAELDQIILSVHGFDEFWVIDHSTTTAEAASHSGGTYGKGGDLLYRWGNPAAYGASGDHEFYGQHDAQWIPSGTPGAGNILVYNNGQGGNGYSTVEEIVPDINPDGSYPITVGQAFGPSSQLWFYNEDGSDSDFYGANISGAQRLPNGNTLICEGPSGYIFEVTYDGTVVWTYQNTDGTAVFRANKYPYDYSGLSQL